MKKLLVVTVLCMLVAALLISAGCGKKAQTTTPKTSTNAVEIVNFAFNPDTITVAAGTEVTWTNNGNTAHTVTGTNFESGEIQPGQSYKHTFSSAGTYDYHCSIHTSMTGQVVVTGGGASTETVPTTPAPTTPSAPPGY